MNTYCGIINNAKQPITEKPYLVSRESFYKSILYEKDILLINNLPIFLLVTSYLLASCEKQPANDDTNLSESPLTERIIMDTAYGIEPLQKMDIYLPEGRDKTTKVIVLIHGGGWAAGVRSEVDDYKNILRQKWPQAAVVNISYRLASNIQNIHYQKIMDDISSTVNFIVKNKNQFTVSDTLAMVGISAGGHLAMLYTYKYNTNNYVKAVADFFGPARLSDWEWYNSFNIWVGKSIKDVLVEYLGEPWNLSLYDANSPHVIVNEQSAPTIIFHGTIDFVVPIYQSQWLSAKLKELNVPYEYYEYFLDGHGFNPTNTDDALTKTVDFFKKHLN